MADWKDVLGTLAPTVASALGGPLAGAAVTAIGAIFGVKDSTTKDIADAFSSGKLTAEQLGKLKELELEYQNNEKERQFKYAELEFKDVDSARRRETIVKDNTNKILAYIVVGAFIAMAWSVLSGTATVDSVLAGTIIGYVSAKCEQVLSYYFGSTKSSARKTELIAQAPATEKD